MTAPSPRCGRLDDHAEHDWTRVSLYHGNYYEDTYHCPGHVTIEGGALDREADDE